MRDAFDLTMRTDRIEEVALTLAEVIRILQSREVPYRLFGAFSSNASAIRVRLNEVGSYASVSIWRNRNEYSNFASCSFKCFGNIRAVRAERHRRTTRFGVLLPKTTLAQR